MPGTVRPDPSTLGAAGERGSRREDYSQSSQAARAAPEPDGLVFRSGRGTYLQRSNFSRLVWRPAVQQLGLDGLRFHDLRHTAATLAAAAGATTRELMDRMGHTSPAVALRYQHIMADRQGAIAAALDGLVRDAQQGGRRRRRARGGHDGPRRGSNGSVAGG
jgi:integrase